VTQFAATFFRLTGMPHAARDAGRIYLGVVALRRKFITHLLSSGCVAWLGTSAIAPSTTAHTPVIAAIVCGIILWLKRSYDLRRPNVAGLWHSWTLVWMFIFLWSI